MSSGFPTANKPPFNPFNSLLAVVPVMDRYIIGELIPPFIFGVGAFSSIGVAIGVLFDLVRKITEAGLPLTLALEIFFLKLPYFISLAFPMSMLLACLIVYSRLSSDSELIALRSCGVSIYRLVLPAVLLGLMMTGITFVFNEAVVPAANRRASVTLDRALKGNEPSFREKNILYQEFRKETLSSGERENVLSRIFYAREFDGKQMKGLNILDFSQNGLNQIVVAETATWNPTEKTWDFFNGTTYTIAPDGSFQGILRYKKQQLQLPRAPLDIATTTTDPIEMNIAQIKQYLATTGEGGNVKETRKLRLRIDQKISFPFVCLVFGLVGSTLGVQPQRGGRRATSFGISLVIIVFYYLFTSICEALYQFGILSSFLAGWLPTITILAAGILLLVRISR
jgi:lipopolysaccharide export system permease protein